MKVVYVAGPYRASTEYGIKTNIRNAEELAIKVWQAGAACICPHLNSAFLGGVIEDNGWLRGDLEIIRRCDALLLVPNWENSVGTRGEVDLAKSIGLPVFERVGQLLDWLDSSKRCSEK